MGEISNQRDKTEQNQVSHETAGTQDLVESMAESGQRSGVTGIGAFDEIGRNLINNQVNDL